jgi:hypothetical protein
VKVAAATLQEHEGKLARNLPERCPFTVEDIVSDAFDFDDALARLCTATVR